MADYCIHGWHASLLIKIIVFIWIFGLWVCLLFFLNNVLLLKSVGKHVALASSKAECVQAFHLQSPFPPVLAGLIQRGAFPTTNSGSCRSVSPWCCSYKFRLGWRVLSLPQWNRCADIKQKIDGQTLPLALVLSFSPIHALSPFHSFPPPLLPASCKGGPPCAFFPPKFSGMGKGTLPSMFRAHAGNTHFHLTDKDGRARLRIVPHTDFSSGHCCFVCAWAESTSSSGGWGSPQPLFLFS